MYYAEVVYHPPPGGNKASMWARVVNSGGRAVVEYEIAQTMTGIEVDDEGKEFAYMTNGDCTESRLYAEMVAETIAGVLEQESEYWVKHGRVRDREGLWMSVREKWHGPLEGTE